MNKERKPRKTSGHGSITKAGKVRKQTPKIQSSSKKNSVSPKIGNRRKYVNRILLGRTSGQNWRV